MKLRLFSIRRHDATSHYPIFYADQKLAKNERDRLTKDTGIQHVLCPGPDHKRYNSFLVEMERKSESEVS